MSSASGGPAFPSHGTMGEVAHHGMTLRDYFAAKAMQGMLSDLPKTLYGLDWKEKTAGAAYELADAMLAARGPVETDDERRERLEFEHLGDPEKCTGIYANVDAVLDWKMTEGGAWEAGPYLVVERIDGKGWNADYNGESLQLATGLALAKDVCRQHATRNGWIDWHGHAECPVIRSCVVEALSQSGGYYKGRADHLDWSGGIVRYRLVGDERV